MLYGADLTGISSSMLRQQRSVISRASTAPAAGTNPMVALWTLDCMGSKTDPAFGAHEMPITQYARACYDAWIPMDILEKAFGNTEMELASSNNKWAMVKGPIAATILSANRLEWVFTSASKVVTDAGERLDFTEDSPAFVESKVACSVRRMIARELDTDFPHFEIRRQRSDHDRPQKGPHEQKETFQH